MQYQYTTWIEINKLALEHNVAQYKHWLGDQTGIAPVVKANAYGHGLVQVGLLHDQNPSVVRLCVASSQEGVQLRIAGVQKPILVLGFINTPLADVVQHKLDMVVHDVQTIYELNHAAQEKNIIINVHLKIDTGLSRLGIFPDQFPYFVELIKTLPFLHLQGICSHLIEASNELVVHEQEEVFKSFFDSSLQMHMSNSHGALHSKYRYSFIRIGAGLYGYLPEADPSLQSLLQPVLSLKTRVIGLKTVSVGATVGYGKTYIAQRQTKLAVLGMGYFEGMNPDLSNTGKVLIRGQFAPVVGRIMMNYFTVDVTDIPQVQLHDVATVLGRDGDRVISAYDWRVGAKKNVRIFLAQINPAVERIVVEQPVVHWLQSELDWAKKASL